MFCPKDGSKVIRVKGTAAKAGYGIISQYIVLGFIGSKHRQTSCFFRKLFHTARTKIHQDLISNVLRIRRRRCRLGVAMRLRPNVAPPSAFFLWFYFLFCLGFNFYCVCALSVFLVTLFFMAEL